MIPVYTRCVRPAHRLSLAAPVKLGRQFAVRAKSSESIHRSFACFLIPLRMVCNGLIPVKASPNIEAVGDKLAVARRTRCRPTERWRPSRVHRCGPCPHPPLGAPAAFITGDRKTLGYPAAQRGGPRLVRRDPLGQSLSDTSGLIWPGPWHRRPRMARRARTPKAFLNQESVPAMG